MLQSQLFYKTKKETPMINKEDISIDPNQINGNKEVKEEIKQEVVENENINETVL